MATTTASTVSKTRLVLDMEPVVAGLTPPVLVSGAELPPAADDHALAGQDALAARPGAALLILGHQLSGIRQAGK